MLGFGLNYERLKPHERAQYKQRLRQIQSRASYRRAEVFAKYREDPEGYAEKVLGVQWWDKQKEVARAIIEHQKVFVKASHDVGKTHLSGGLVNWHFDCFDPGLTLTTAPTQTQVVDLTWKEVRLQRKGKGMMPKAARLESYLPSGEINPAHVAAGYTARDSNAFQGHHAEHLLIIFEEAVGVQEQFWTAAEGMLSSGPGNKWLAIMNPTDIASYAYQQELTGDWHVITISALDHPNIAAELEGQPKPFPKAISLSWVEGKFKRWCTAIEESDRTPLDICWPPEEFCRRKGIEPQWYRPGPLFEGRVMGRWPSTAVDSIWSEALWMAAIKPKPDLQAKSKEHKPEIGCDVARFGDDDTTIHGRQGAVSLHHEAHNGWATTTTAGRLNQLAEQLAHQAGCDKSEVVIKIDDSGVGGGVTDQALALGLSAFGVNSAEKALDEEHYPNKRSELWFTVAGRAFENDLDLSRLSQEVLDKLRRQLMAPNWKPDSRGRRVVEPKDQTKKRIGRSPDDADAFNLAYAGVNPNAMLGYLYVGGVSGWGFN